MTASHWIVRAVLRAWPRDLRDRHGRAFAQAFVTSWRDARGGFGPWQRVTLVTDAIGAGWCERRAGRPSHNWRSTMRSLPSEVGTAWRALRARPLSALAIVLTLGIGLCATVAMFGVMDAVLLRPLPFPEDDRLVTMTERHATRPLSGTSVPAVQDWAALDGVASLGVYDDSGGVLQAAAEPVRVDGVMASPGFFHTLGIAAALGRTLITKLFAGIQAELAIDSCRSCVYFASPARTRPNVCSSVSLGMPLTNGRTIGPSRYGMPRVSEIDSHCS